jgi:GGDEF domain-containing protein
MQARPPRRRPARPVADAPIEPLLLRAEDLAKGWLLAVLEEEPLERAGAVMGTELRQEGPALCEAVLRALVSDEDLARLEPGGPLQSLATRAGELTGAQGPAAVSRSVEALRAVLWRALRDELAEPDPDQLYELAERLSTVTELLRGAAFRGAGASVAPADDGTWRAALENEIAQARRTRSPLSLLVVELDDADRVVASETPEVASEMLAVFAEAVRSAVRPEDVLADEAPTRAWIIMREAGGTEAQSLASQIAAAVGEAKPWRGAPLRVSTGISVLRDDGYDPDALIDAAEQARFAAEASGQPQA